jgi:hypothetical protein
MPGGTAEVTGPYSGVVRYRAELAAAPVLFAAPPKAGRDDGPLDLSGVTPEMAELAASVAGSGTPLERAVALERHLRESYRYSLDFLGKSGDNALADFLFRYKTGHCEYFASSMVLLLRSQGIPARLITGFLGADFNPIEGYYIVRQSNAHAWVEAYLPELGWQQFDPTPVVGRPASRRSGLLALFGQAYDYLNFRWDRYVIAYGFGDQMQMFLRLRDAWSELWEQLRSKRKARRGEPAPEPAQAEQDSPASEEAARSTWPWWLGLGVLLAAGGALPAVRRRPPTALEAYRKLRGLAERHEVAVAESTPPLALLARLGAADEELGRAASPVVDLYLAESFGGRATTLEERRALEAALAATQAAARRHAQRRRRERQAEGSPSRNKDRQAA